MNKIFQSFVFISTIVVLVSISSQTFSLATTTGDSKVENVVETQVNINIKDCDCTPTPTSQVTPTPIVTATPTPVIEVSPTPTEKITPAPTTQPQGGGDSSNGESNNKSSSPIQAVLGLSSTNSDINPMVQFGQLVLALVLSIVGFKFFKKNA